MSSLRVAAVLAASLALAPFVPVHADNPMGYRLLTAQEASTLPRGNGAVGLDVDRGQQLTDGGMTFDIIRIKQVRRDSAAARAGLKPGDEIIALDGRVFPTLTVFASYIRSLPPGTKSIVDYMPVGSGPQQAQRVALVVGQAGQPAQPAARSGMSTTEKVAIGAGAVALLGCYAAGCFTHHDATVRPPPQPMQQQPQQQSQQQRLQPNDDQNQ